LRDAFIDQRTHHRTALRPAHAFPRDRWASVQNHMRVHARDHIARKAHANECRSRRFDTPDCFLIRRIDVDACLRYVQARHAIDRRLPIDIDHGHALLFHRLRHTAEADVDDGERLSK